MVDDPRLRAFILRRTRPGKWACIEWTGAKNRKYGQILYEGHQMVAPRVSWILRHRQPIPNFLQIDHLCMNPGCVNPDHLDVVDAQENNRRIHTPPEGWVPVNHPDHPRRRKLRGTQMRTLPNPMFEPSIAA